MEKRTKSPNIVLEKRITMISRRIDKEIDAVYRDSKIALMLTGARQVGKTNAFRRLAERMFKNYVEINFIETPEARNIFIGAANAKDILLRLSAFADRPLIPGETLILFDEVQRCPECVTQIKFLVDEGSYRYGLTGSLLGVELQDLFGKPIPYVLSEIPRRITEALVQDDRINDVTDYDISYVRDNSQGKRGDVLVKFKIQSIYGDIEMQKEVAI